MAKNKLRRRRLLDRHLRRAYDLGFEDGATVLAENLRLALRKKIKDLK